MLSNGKLKHKTSLSDEDIEEFEIPEDFKLGESFVLYNEYIKINEPPFEDVKKLQVVQKNK